jgi:Na+-transporting methylmalonyl-CoA/oxaloacetate decarboxylase gamma subunit
MSEAEALDRLRDILARPEFRLDTARSWWEQLQAVIFEVLFNVWAQLAQTIANAASGRAGWLGLAVLGVGLVLVVLVVAYLVRAIRLAVVRESKLAAESRAERRERSDRLWASAQQHAAHGDWPAAVRLAYLSALYALDEHALLHVQSGLTNREHAAQLAHAHPEVGSTFAELVLRYDRLRYGHYPITAEAFADMSHLVVQARALSPA